MKTLDHYAIYLKLIKYLNELYLNFKNKEKVNLNFSKHDKILVEHTHKHPLIAAQEATVRT